MKRIDASKILKSDGTLDDIAIASAGNSYSQSHKMAYGESFCLSLRAKVSSGTPDVDVYIEQTHIAPGTEGAAGDTTTGWIRSGSKIADLTDENWQHVTISPLTLEFIRLHLDGQGANPASTVVEAHLSQLSDIGR